MVLNNLINLFNKPAPGGYVGEEHWVYYLIGAIFLILGIIMIVLSYLWRHSRREAENYNYLYDEFKRFWQLNKFGFAVMLSIIFIITAIIFFIMNPIILSK